jgi:hypothetical protein
MLRSLGVASIFLLLIVPAPGQNPAAKSEPGQEQRNSGRSPIEVVRVFYTSLTTYRPLGIPKGRAKTALWPLISKRLVRELETLQSCEDDYFKRYGEYLRANQFKPRIGWLEDGLFSGPNEAASPSKFSILSSKTVGENRVDVHLRFTHKQTYCCGYPPQYEHYEGVVTVVLEDDRYVIDDFVAVGVTPLVRLSDGYAGCKSGQWVGRPGDDPRSTPEDATAPSSPVSRLSQTLVGKRITIRGKLLTFKCGQGIQLDDEEIVCLIDMHPKSSDDPYPEMYDKLVEATGTLRFYHNPTPVDETRQREEDHYYFEYQTTQVRLITH